MIKKLNEEIKCRARNEPGHWYEDREKCLEMMLMKKKKQISESPSVNQSLCADTDPPMKDKAKEQPIAKSLFQQ